MKTVCFCGSDLLPHSGLCRANVIGNLLCRDERFFLGNTPNKMGVQFPKKKLWTLVAPKSIFTPKQNIVLDSDKNFLLLTNRLGAGKTSVAGRLVMEQDDYLHRTMKTPATANQVAWFKMGELVQYHLHEVLPMLKSFPVLHLAELEKIRTAKGRERALTIFDTIMDVRLEDPNLFTSACTNLSSEIPEADEGDEDKEPELSPLADYLGSTLVDRLNDQRIVDFPDEGFRSQPDKRFEPTPEQQASLERRLYVSGVPTI